MYQMPRASVYKVLLSISALVTDLDLPYTVTEMGLDAAQGRRGDGDDNVQGGVYLLQHARQNLCRLVPY